MSDWIQRFVELPAYGELRGLFVVLLLYMLKAELLVRRARARAHCGGEYDRKSTYVLSAVLLRPVFGFVLAMRQFARLTRVAPSSASRRRDPRHARGRVDGRGTRRRGFRAAAVGRAHPARALHENAARERRTRCRATVRSGGCGMSEDFAFAAPQRCVASGNAATLAAKSCRDRRGVRVPR